MSMAAAEISRDIDNLRDATPSGVQAMLSSKHSMSNDEDKSRIVVVIQLLISVQAI